MFDKKIFGQRLKDLRTKKNLTQLDLANLLGVSKVQICEIESGKRTTTIDKLYQLADFFNVTIDYLVGRTDNK